MFILFGAEADVLLNDSLEETRVLLYLLCLLDQFFKHRQVNPEW